MGLLQIAQGQQSDLRFFEITNPEDAVGFFANRNHFAALLYCLIPFVVAWTLDKMTANSSSQKKEHAIPYDISSIIAATLGFMALVIVLAGEITARSRADQSPRRSLDRIRTHRYSPVGGTQPPV